jgi:hypothetical protein
MRADVVIGLLCATALAMASTADASVSTDASVRSPASQRAENAVGLIIIRAALARGDQEHIIGLGHGSVAP